MSCPYWMMGFLMIWGCWGDTGLVSGLVKSAIGMSQLWGKV
ncbi:hypothetical protein [Microcoleus sp. PH2017_22_RUC_O_B]|nr:hypothetical protein [Microcoleus sp. PH2017_22_RUC_O_B]